MKFEILEQVYIKLLIDYLYSKAAFDFTTSLKMPK